MSFLSNNQSSLALAEESVSVESDLPNKRVIQWEIEQTPEALYKRISEIFKLFSSGKYSKALAVQRLLDLLYDINDTKSAIYTKAAKSRYFLLIFTYIYRIRSIKVRFTNIATPAISFTDQRMYIGGIDFSGLNLPGLRVNNALFECCNFSSANLQEMSASSCQFERCKFDSVNLKQADIANSVFEGVTFTSGNLSSSRFVKSSFVGCDFSELISSRGHFPLRINGCEMVACSFREADLLRADFRKTRMTGCDTLDAKKKDAKGLL